MIAGRVIARFGWVAAISFGLWASGCTHEEPVDPEPLPLVPVSQVATPEDPIDPIPLDQNLDARKIELGAQLFKDPILSPSGDISCATCHDFQKGGADGRDKSNLGGHPPALVNTPTIFNAALNYRYHWSGKFDDLESELEIPVTSPRVLATTFDAIVVRLKKSSTYPGRFTAIYPDGITPATFKDVMAEYERSLVTPNSRFDKYLRGDTSALTTEEHAGYALFKSYGCISCHQGVNVGGNLFQKFGAMRDYFKDRGNVQEGDLGRYIVTKREEDRYVFRVASLRNIALTAPYFHDATAKTLEDAVQTMAKYQLGRKLSPDQIRQIVAFLKTLTGEYAGEALN